MKPFPLLLAVLLLAAAFAAPARAQAAAGPEAEVRAVIDRMFDAMRRGDGAALGALFHPTARLQSVGVSRQTNEPVLRTDSMAAFVRAVGTPHEAVWDERISDVQIKVDGNFATAWMNYSFYTVTNGTDQLSHCGINAFQFFRGTDGWKVIQITDTRRRENCPALPAGAR
ncbi:MAG TPA: DUF4440 domain-containing protein [Longimicrobium sp.]